MRASARRRWRRRCFGSKAADFQYRSGLHVHRRGFRRQARGGRRRAFHRRRGRFMDNIFIERLWRSITYEEVHLKATPTAARRGPASVPRYFLHSRRPHQAMNNQTPMRVRPHDKIERAADMPLRLQPNALPTYPQQSRSSKKRLFLKDKAGELHLKSNDPCPTNGVQFILPIRRLQNGKPFRFEGAPKNPPHFGLVINDKNIFPTRHALPSRFFASCTPQRRGKFSDGKLRHLDLSQCHERPNTQFCTIFLKRNRGDDAIVFLEA